VLCRRVSTRRVDDVVKAMGIDGISKSQVSELAKSLEVPGNCAEEDG